MWVNRQLFDLILKDNKEQQYELDACHTNEAVAIMQAQDAKQQKIKDDLTIDWLRNRVNALEKERNVLLQRAAGIVLPTPEIVVTPRLVDIPDFNTLPSFDDPGDEAAQRLGIQHDEEGALVYTK